MFAGARYENERPDGIGVLEVSDGGDASEEQPRRFVPLRRTELRGEIMGPLASLRVSHVYGYTRDQCPDALEAVYRFPLPGDAAVTAVRVQFGEVEIETELKERQRAEAEYEEARAEGRQAALLSRESPDVFTLRVAGIQPDEEVRVETSYVQLARAEGVGWSLRIPLTTSPRYVRGDERNTRHAEGQPLLLLRDPGHRFALDLEILGAGEVSSPTHALALARKEDRVRVSLEAGEVIPDRDCVLSWRPEQEASRSSFQVWLHEDRDAGQVYFLGLLAPPSVPEPGEGIPREIVLLVDHSGSMHGAKWAAADWAVKRFLSGLTERDVFALGLFHNHTRWFAPGVRPANAAAVREAIQYLERHRDSGGTELGVALEQALELERASGEYARHVLVITDAEVTDAGRLLRLADREATREERRRISDLCIDAAPNALLALDLAERGGGVARFLTSDPNAEDISTALDEVLADWSQPVLTGLQLALNRPDAQAAGREAAGDGIGDSRIDLGDLPTGRTRWVVGRVPRTTTPELSLRVLDPHGRSVKERRFDLDRETHARPALKALFGARRLLTLEQLRYAGYEREELESRLRRLGYDPATLLGNGSGREPKVYAENVFADAEAAFRKLLTAESLAFGLVSSETAFVAVRKERGKPVGETVVVGNALPAGWSSDFLSMPSSARASSGLGFLPPRVQPAMFRVADAAPGQPGPPGRRGGRTASRRQGPESSGPLGQGGQDVWLSASAAAPAVAPGIVQKRGPLFTGTPSFTAGEAILFDTRRDEDRLKLPDGMTLSSLRVRFPAGAPDPATIDSGLCLLLFVADLSEPRARVRLADLLRLGGERPLNLVRQPGDPVRLVLVDPAGAWKEQAPALEVEIA